MNIKWLLSGWLLILSFSLQAIPRFVTPTSFGDVPISIANRAQVKTQTIRVCNFDSGVHFLTLNISIQSGNESGEWRLEPEEYQPFENDCQDFTLTLTPVSTGSKHIIIVAEPCQIRFTNCNTSFAVSANVITQQAFEERLASGVYDAGTYQYLDPELSNGQPLYDTTNVQLRLVGQTRMVTMDLLPGGFGFREESPVSFSANSLICPAGNQIVNIPSRLTDLALYDQSASSLGRPSSGALPGVSNCVRTEAENRRLRLVQSSCPPSLTDSPVAGRVEVLAPNDNYTTWGTVCDDGDWDDYAARVICRSLGASGGTAYNNARCGSGSDPIWLDEVSCQGDEDFLEQCTSNTVGVHNCDHTEDAAVSCDTSDFGSNRLLPAECPDISNGKLPFVTCANGAGQYSYSELDLAAFTNPDITLGGSKLILDISTSHDLQGWLYTRTGHLLALGARLSSLLTAGMDGQWTVQQTTSDIKGRFPMVEIDNSLYAVQRDSETEPVVLRHFDIRNNRLFRDSERFEHITLNNPGRMIIYGNTIIISELFQETGISRFRVLLITNSNSRILGLSDLVPATTMTEAMETPQPQNHGSALHTTLWGSAIFSLLAQLLTQ